MQATHELDLGDGRVVDFDHEPSDGEINRVMAEIQSTKPADNRSGGIMNQLASGIARGVSFGKYGQDAMANSVMTPKGERWAGKIGEVVGAAIPASVAIAGAGALGIPAAIESMGGGAILQSIGSNLAAAAIHGRMRGAALGQTEPEIRRGQIGDAATFVPLGIAGEAAGGLRRWAKGAPANEAQAWLKPPKTIRDEMLAKNEPSLGDQYLQSQNYKGINSQEAAYNKAVAHMPSLEADVQTELQALKDKALTPNRPSPAPAPPVNPITKQPMAGPGLEYRPTPVEVQPENPSTPWPPGMKARPSYTSDPEVIALPYKNEQTADPFSNDFHGPNPWRAHSNPGTFSGRTYIEQNPEIAAKESAYGKGGPQEVKDMFRRQQELEAQKMAQPTPKQGPNIDLSNIPQEQKSALLDPLIENYKKIPGAGDKVQALTMLRDNPVNDVGTGNLARRVLDNEVGNWYGKPRAEAPFNIDGMEVLANDIRGQMANLSPKMADLMNQYHLDLRVARSLGPQVANPRSTFEAIGRPVDSLRRAGGMNIARTADFASKFVPNTPMPKTDALAEVISRALANQYAAKKKSNDAASPQR